MTSDGVRHAFISYVKEDKDKVDELCRLLEQAGIPYWRDRRNLEAGQDWKAEIRDAIRDDSLVFVACFSENSVQKQKSYMNEELTLAVDEFRMRPPGATWIVPVRFDEIEVPAYQLGGGRMLNDLNYADLFGRGYTSAAVGLITTLNKVMGALSKTPANTTAAIESAATEARKDLFRRATKEMVLDPRRRIELDDLVKAETRRVLTALNDKDAMPLDLTRELQEDPGGEVVRRALAIADLVEPLCWSMQVASRWAPRETLSIWTGALDGLAADAVEPRSGLTSLISLRYLPALMVMTTGAVAAYAQGNWSGLRDIVTLPVSTAGGQNEPVLNVISPYRPFDNEKFLANLLANLAQEGPEADVDDLVSRSSTLMQFRTPVSDWLLLRLAPVFEQQFARNSEFEDKFTQAEVFLGVVSEDEARTASAPWRSSSWYGRATWADRRRGRNSVAELQAAFEAAGTEWPPLKAGFFAGDVTRARKAFEAYADSYVRVSNQR